MLFFLITINWGTCSLLYACSSAVQRSGKKVVPEQQHCLRSWSSIGGMLVESALFVLGLLCFRCVFSVKIAITNFWRDRSFFALIQTVVQASWFFPRWSFSNQVTLNWTNISGILMNFWKSCTAFFKWVELKLSNDKLHWKFSISCYAFTNLFRKCSKWYIHSRTFSPFSILK